MDRYLCKQCEQKIPSHEKEEHEDWHLAMDLQSQEENGGGSGSVARNIAPQPSLQTKPPPQDKKQNGGGNDHQPPAYAPPSQPPPASGASRANIRHHTNKVIEAAALRAKDEVRLSLARDAANAMTDVRSARNAERITESAVPISHLQQRD